MVVSSNAEGFETPNRRHTWHYPRGEPPAQGTSDSLVFTTERAGKTPGQLASFVRNKTNDILLPLSAGSQPRARRRVRPAPKHRQSS